MPAPALLVLLLMALAEALCPETGACQSHIPQCLHVLDDARVRYLCGVPQDSLGRGGDHQQHHGLKRFAARSVHDNETLWRTTTHGDTFDRGKRVALGARIQFDSGVYIDSVHTNYNVHANSVDIDSDLDVITKSHSKREDTFNQRLVMLECSILSHCFEHRAVTAMDTVTLEAVIEGGNACVKTLQDLIEADATASAASFQFSAVLARYDCAQSYSNVHNCSDCLDTYRQWVCSSLIPFYRDEVIKKPKQQYDSQKHQVLEKNLRVERSYSIEKHQKEIGHSSYTYELDHSDNLYEYLRDRSVLSIEKQLHQTEMHRQYIEYQNDQALAVSGSVLDASLGDVVLGGEEDAWKGRRRRRIKPCLSVCNQVEQDCPYLLPGDAHPTQYAGEPTFLCLDPNIPETGEQALRSSHGTGDCCYTYCAKDVCAFCGADSMDGGQWSDSGGGGSVGGATIANVTDAVTTAPPAGVGSNCAPSSLSAAASSDANRASAAASGDANQTCVLLALVLITCTWWRWCWLRSPADIVLLTIMKIKTHVFNNIISHGSLLIIVRCVKKKKRKRKLSSSLVVLNCDAQTLDDFCECSGTEGPLPAPRSGGRTR